MLIASCGGGGGSSAPVAATPSAAPAGAAVGVLTDSPIEGVEYTTSGGFTGFTDGAGHYNYNPGETVTFRIGAIVLGTVPATGTVTPLELAGTGPDAASKTTNLLVLLQSLDEDRSAAGGIRITAAARAAATAPLDLSVAPATFVAAPALGTLLASAGLPSTPVSTADALAHFRDQFYSQLRGGWVYRDASTAFVFRFGTNGRYAYGEVGPAESSGSSGIELGQLTWDAATGRFTSTPSLDTNGEWGPSHAGAADTMRLDGAGLVFTDGDDGAATTLVRVPNDPDGLVGMWALGSPTGLNVQTLVFFGNNRFMMIDPVGDTGGNCPVVRGVEYGSYTFDAAAGTLAVTQPPLYDTNGCAGLWDSVSTPPFGINETLVFNADKSQFTVGDATFHRILP
ncbi:MAG TPA: hypothetical protein VFE82_15485 [Ramlibacter sp.]|jgi:hypothetical protein|uniref:hypothetical protein n=1 Tax=Ramlibacter sp. TaxID=1917967 RepID=UPI002D24B6D6|nr:hypothetical protein [Ramlibacter sp.]HZY19875.1 hypothetical protein [Ramlibacter sp.]